MQNAAPALVALAVAVTALGVALFRGPQPPSPDGSPPPVAPSGSGDLERRVADLEAELGRLSVRMLSPALHSTDSREAVGVGKDEAALAERVAELEAQVAELRASPKPAADPNAGTRIDAETRALEREQQLEQWLAAARNGAATEEELLLALRNLRGARLPDGTDARLGVLPQMIRLGETSADEKARADVWRQLSGVTDRSLLAPLLRALQSDPSGEVREEAAETLADFLPDPEVENALRYAAENDADPDVRRQALASLGGGRR